MTATKQKYCSLLLNWIKSINGMFSPMCVQHIEFTKPIIEVTKRGIERGAMSERSEHSACAPLKGVFVMC